MNKHHLDSVDRERLFVHIAKASTLWGRHQDGEADLAQRQASGRQFSEGFASAIVRNKIEPRHVRWLATLLAALCDELEKEPTP